MAIMSEIDVAVPLPKFQKGIVRKPNLDARCNAKKRGATMIEPSSFDITKIEFYMSICVGFG